MQIFKYLSTFLLLARAFVITDVMSLMFLLSSEKFIRLILFVCDFL